MTRSLEEQNDYDRDLFTLTAAELLINGVITSKTQMIEVWQNLKEMAERRLSQLQET